MIMRDHSLLSTNARRNG